MGVLGFRLRKAPLRWREQDSNLRRHGRQIYSLIPLTAWVSLRKEASCELSHKTAPCVKCFFPFFVKIFSVGLNSTLFCSLGERRKIPNNGEFLRKFREERKRRGKKLELGAEKDYNSLVMTNPKDPNSPPIPVPETMEEFRAMSREAMAMAAKTAASLDRAEERDAKREARDAKREARDAKRDARDAKREAQLDKLITLAGGNNKNTGRVLEQEVIAKVKRDGKIAWMRADEIYPNLTKIVKRRVLGEYDLVVINGSEVMVVEVKRVLRAEEVRKFAEKDLAKFRERFPEIVGDRAVYGAVAFSLEEENPKARKAAMSAAEKAGLLLIRAVGKTGLEFMNPDREKLRAARG